MYKLDRGRQWLAIIIAVVMSFAATFILASNVSITGAGIVALVVGVFVFAGAVPTIILRYLFKIEVTRRDASECAFIVSAIWGVFVAYGSLFVQPLIVIGVPVLIFIAWGSSRLTAIIIAKARMNVEEVHG